MPRGRPQDPAKQQASKQALLQAARDLLEQKPYRSITIRELAQHAGLQSAMVSYYFTSKEGLFITLLDETGEQRQAALQQVAADVLAQPDQALTILVDNMISLVSADPWLVRLLQDEILTQQSQLRHAFLEAVPRRMSQGMVQLLTTLIEQGILRPELNPQFTAATLMSNVMFPFLAEPVMSETVAINRDVVRGPAWKNHVSQVLSRGLMLHPTSQPQKPTDKPTDKPTPRTSDTGQHDENF